MPPLVGHTCGTIFDYLRVGYRIDMRTYIGGEPTPVVWFEAPPGAKHYEGPTPFRSRNWLDETEQPNDDLGEQRPAGECWYPPASRQQLSHLYVGRAPCINGPAQELRRRFKDGGTPGVDPPVILDADGKAVCCPAIYRMSGEGGQAQGGEARTGYIRLCAGCDLGDVQTLTVSGITNGFCTNCESVNGPHVVRVPPVGPGPCSTEQPNDCCWHSDPYDSGCGSATGPVVLYWAADTDTWTVTMGIGASGAVVLPLVGEFNCRGLNVFAVGDEVLGGYCHGPVTVVWDLTAGITGEGGQVQGGQAPAGVGPLPSFGGQAQGGEAPLAIAGQGGQVQGGEAPLAIAGEGGQVLGGEAPLAIAGEGGQVLGGEAPVALQVLGQGGQAQGGQAQGGGQVLGQGGQVQGGQASVHAGYVAQSQGGQVMGGEAPTWGGFIAQALGGQVQGGEALTAGDDDVPITGEVRWYAGDPAGLPAGWLPCDGAAVSRTTYAALWGVCGVTYGAGNGSSTFNVPNLKQKFPMGNDDGNSVFRGATGGAATHTLTLAELPAHAHGILPNGHQCRLNDVNDATGTWQASVSGGSRPVFDIASTQNAGAGGAHNNLPPYLVLTAIIKT